VEYHAWSDIGEVKWGAVLDTLTVYDRRGEVLTWIRFDLLGSRWRTRALETAMNAWKARWDNAHPARAERPPSDGEDDACHA
jgi:hypothetical protein